MKPEDGLHHHVDGGGQIVVPSHVLHFVSQDSLKMSVLQMFGDSRRPKQRWPENAENTGLERALR